MAMMRVMTHAKVAAFLKTKADLDEGGWSQEEIAKGTGMSVKDVAAALRHFSDHATNTTLLQSEGAEVQTVQLHGTTFARWHWLRQEDITEALETLVANGEAVSYVDRNGVRRYRYAPTGAAN